MLSAGMNANLGGRDHMALEVEQQLVEWARELFGFPQGSSGLFVTGTSQANFMGLLIARTRALGPQVRESTHRRPRLASRLTTYASRAVHEAASPVGRWISPASAADNLRPGRASTREPAHPPGGPRGGHRRGSGGGPAALRGGGLGRDRRRRALSSSDLAGLWPPSPAARGPALPCRRGAFGALRCRLLSRQTWPHGWPGSSRRIPSPSTGTSGARSPTTPASCWCATPTCTAGRFSAEAAYLRRSAKGLAGGEWWPCDYGPDLSRSFRALKTWFTLKTYGADAIGAAIARTCDLARALGELVAAEPELEVMAPAQLNIVCFRFRGEDADALNETIVARLQSSGLAAPSLTQVGGATAIRCAIVNHRTDLEDVAAVVRGVLALGRAVVAEGRG